ncbi:MAG: hypothetical protein ACLT3R_08665 [Roseburia sp.]
MAKFIYRMQNILDIKLKLESQAKIAYSQANAALREEEAKLLKLFERKNAYDNRAKELVEGKIDLLEIKKCRQAIESMKVLIRRQMMQVQVAEKMWKPPGETGRSYERAKDAGKTTGKGF